MSENLLSQYEAAALIGISPHLLEYFTEHTTKSDDPRKLVAHSKINKVIYFEKNELLEYNNWLKKPWPCNKNGRPHLPDAIKKEIREEANSDCAVCARAGDSCEAAHIDPVCDSKCNHPHNLIWLCSNHHIKFDRGLIGPKGIGNEFIATAKRHMQNFRKLLWSGQATAIQNLANSISLCKDIYNKATLATTPEEAKLVERLALSTIAAIPKLASQSNSADLTPVLNRLTTQLTNTQKPSYSNTIQKLEIVASFEQEFLAASGLVLCPLCKGQNFRHYDCPACMGDGTVNEHLVIDLSQYEMVDCRLCIASGRYHELDCPACGGGGELERRFADRIDYAQYAYVKCKLCTGKGRHQGRDCPICNGDGEIQQRHAENIDYSQYQEILCPVCKGSGSWNGIDCPPCQGEGQMPREKAIKIDLSDYTFVDCTLCQGTGSYEGNTCLACEGERSIPKYISDKIDLSDYASKPCPICKGSGEFAEEQCRACNGERQMTASAIEKLDLSLFQLVKCGKCKGKRQHHDDDCSICKGTGKMLRLYEAYY